MIRSVLISLMLMSSTVLLSQTIVVIQPDIGYFLYHSDNSLPITNKADLDLNYGMSMGVQFGLNEKSVCLIRFSYCYANKTLEVWKQRRVDEFGNILEEWQYSNKLVQQSFPIDISLLYRFNETIYIGGGPSVAGSNHAIIFQKEDKFNSFGIGANLIIQKYISLTQSGSLNLVLDGTLRYIKSIKHFNDERDLSNYNLDFLQLQVSIGIAL